MIGNHERALELSEKAIKEIEARGGEASPDFILHKANALAYLGQLEEAERIYKDMYAKQKASGNESYFITMAGFMHDFYWRHGLEKKALKFLRKILRYPNIPPLHCSKVNNKHNATQYNNSTAQHNNKLTFIFSIFQPN